MVCQSIRTSPIDIEFHKRCCGPCGACDGGGNPGCARVSQMAGRWSIPPPGSSVRRAGHPSRGHFLLDAGAMCRPRFREPANTAGSADPRDEPRSIKSVIRHVVVGTSRRKAPAEDRAEQELRVDAPSRDRQISERVLDTAPFPLSSRHDCLQALRLFALRGRFDPQRRRTTEARKNWKSGTAMTGTFYERPILNSPYEEPTLHHALDEEGQPTDDPPVSARRHSELVTSVSRPRKHRKKASPEQTAMDLHTDDTGLVVAVGIVGLQNAESITDRDPWRDNQKTARELPAGRRADRVDRLPRHQHGHDGRFARTGRHFHGEPDQLRVGLLVRSLDMSAGEAL